MALTESEIRRYSRQILLREVGGRGQERLLAATATLRGAGPALAPVCLYLAGAGVGTIRLNDPGAVAPDDIGGWVFRPDDIGRARADVLASAVHDRNPDVRVVVDSASAADLDVSGADVAAALRSAVAWMMRELG